MFSLFTHAAKDLSTHGDTYSQLEEKGQEIIGNLRAMREKNVVNYLLESQLIEQLQEVEDKKTNASLRVTTKMTLDGAKNLVPGGEIIKATYDVVDGTAQLYQQDQQNLPQHVMTSLAKVGERKIRGALLSEANNLATNIVGATALTLAAPALLTTGGIVLALHPTGRTWITNVGKGLMALGKQGIKCLRNDKTTLILNSYNLYREKKVELIEKEAAKTGKESEVTETANRLETLQLELTQARQTLQNCRTRLLGRLVYCINQSSGFYGFITSLFCALSSRFEQEKIAQDTIRLRIEQKVTSIGNTTTQLHQLRLEIRTLTNTIRLTQSALAEREHNYHNTITTS